MAREDVNIKVSANVAEAVRLWKAMEEGPQAMAREMDAAAATGKRGARGMAAEFDKFVGKLTAVQMGISAARKVFLEFQQLRQSDLERQSRAAESVDTASRRLFIQTGGMGDIAALRKQVLDVAVARGVLPGQAFGAAEQLVSSGFGANEVLQGGALDEFLKILAATNQSGKQVDPQELAKQMSLYLSASGQELNRANLRAAGGAVYSLFKGTNLQVPAMGRYAQDAGTVTSLTGMGNEQLAVLSQFLGKYDDAKASTAFRAGVVSLATAGAEQKKIEALARIGLTPGQVDFQGESFFDVQRRMTAALQTVSPDVRNVVSKQLFGTEGMPFATTLLTPEGMAETQRLAGLARSRDGFAQAVTVAEGSLESSRAREESRTARAFFTADYVDPELMKQVIQTWIEESKANRAEKTVLKLAAGATFDFNQAWSNDPEASGRAAIRTAGGDEETADILIERAKAKTLEVRVELVDQNQVVIPNKSEVTRRGNQ